MVLNVLYLILWAGLAAYCFYFARKYGAILYVLAGFFVFMFGWRLADMLIRDVFLFAGLFGWIFRGVCLCFLAAVCVLYYRIKRKSD